MRRMPSAMRGGKKTRLPALNARSNARITNARLPALNALGYSRIYTKKKKLKKLAYRGGRARGRGWEVALSGRPVGRRG